MSAESEERIVLNRKEDAERDKAIEEAERALNELRPLIEKALRELESHS